MNQVERFVEHFGGHPDLIVTSPGRVNLIGDHTDYNEGFVLPLAIDRYVTVVARSREDSRVIAHSDSLREPVQFDLAALVHTGPAWGEYLKGVAHSFGHRWPGIELLVHSDLPLGAGLSSSAALELAIARLMTALSGAEWDPVRAARLCQRAENDWVGNACGIMDQLVVANGVEGGALLIDCRSLDMSPQPLPDAVAIIVLDTGTRRQLLDSEYNQRREACQRVADAFEIPALRDLSPEALAGSTRGLTPKDLKRARHVVTENERVLRAASALQHEDLLEVGSLMVESHNSLRDLYEVSTPELDQMVSLALDQPACLGARMTGAGFGGCVVAMFDANLAEPAMIEVADGYRALTGIEPSAYRCRAVAGTSLATALL